MPMHLISTNKTYKGTDPKGREQFLLKIDAENVDKMIAALTELKGGEVAIDVRTSEKVGTNGGAFPSSFIMVRDYIKKDQNDTAKAGSATKFVPKAKVQTAAAASQVNRVKAAVE